MKLGMMSNRLQQGVNTLQGFREDKRNRVSLGTAPPSVRPAADGFDLRPSLTSVSLPAVSYINYGPFTSYAPTYDSTFANIGKEDSDLILGSFGEESSQQGADRCECDVTGGWRRNSCTAAQMFLCLCFCFTSGSFILNHLTAAVQLLS